MKKESTEPTRTEPQDELQRARFKRSLNAMNVVLTPYAFEIALARVKTAAERSGEATPTQIRAIVDDVLSSSEILQGVAESFR
jgi:hypothetical protein